MTSTTNGQAFGIATESVDDDSLDAWINGAKLPERAVTVYARPDLQGEYEALDAELRQLAQRDDDSDGDERLGGKSRSQALGERMHEVRQAMEGSARVFKFRGMGATEGDEIRAEHPKAEGAELTFLILAATCTQPAGMTADRFAKLYENIGPDYFQAILDTAAAARDASKVALPFSLAASVARQMPTS